MDDKETENSLHTISSLKVLRDISAASTREPQKEKQIAIILGKLAVHYYRPDFNQAAAQSMISDMVEDLGDYPLYEIETAIKRYRQNGENRFFPTPGQLISLLKPPKPEPKCRLETFRDYQDAPGPRATKTAAQVLAEHGLKMPGQPIPGPLPYATDKNGPVTQELLASKLVLDAKRSPLASFNAL